MYHDDFKERIARVMIFIVLSFIIIRYLLGIELSDIDQTKIVLGLSVVFMFVNTYYPVVLTRE
jgi:hypothetical protein